MPTGDDSLGEELVRVPIVEERIHVAKAPNETGRITVTSTVATDDVSIRERLTHTSVSVERIPIGRFVDTVPAIRTEGNRTIVPVTEEVMVKRIRLIEEVHLVREDQSAPFEETVALRRLDVSVERSEPDTAASGTAQNAPASLPQSPDR